MEIVGRNLAVVSVPAEANVDACAGCFGEVHPEKQNSDVIKPAAADIRSVAVTREERR